jgi:Domain of unknown function (DUF4105)
VVLKRRRGRIRGWLLGLGLVSLSILVWMAWHTPRHDRLWAMGQERLARVDFEGDQVRIHDFRFFRYRVDGSVAKTAYETRAFRADDLASVWLGISHFGRFGMAHTFMSFGFKDGRNLAISIEARREKDEGYNPLAGLFRKYDLIHVVGDERDIVGVRSHIRNERVYLYRLNLSPWQAENLFVSMLTVVNEIYQSPRFYNTLMDNCLTGIVRYAKAIPFWQRWVDYRLILPGFFDEVAYGLGVLAGEGALKDLQVRALVPTDGYSPDDPAFSIKARREKVFKD